MIRQLWQRWVMRRMPPAGQVRLTRQQIFIVPTRAGAAFGILLLLMLMVAINYQNSLVYGLTFLLLAIFIVAILHTYRNLQGLELRHGGSHSVFAGEQASLNVRLQSSGRDYQAIALGWPGEALQVMDVPADHQIDMTLAIPAKRRGWLAVPRLRVETRFPLGLLVAWSWVDLGQRILIYPKPLKVPLPGGQAAPGDQDEGRVARGAGADDFQGLRPYQPGDPRQRLHWKAYSRGQQLLIKDFAAWLGDDIWLDFDAFAGDREQRLSGLCYWVLELSRRQRMFGLQLPGEQVRPGAGEAHRDECLRALALHGVEA